MFEPLNALEQALMAAATDPAARQPFVQALLESEVYISPAGEPPADGGIGQLVISHQPQGDTPCVFTAPERVAEVVGAGAAVRGLNGRELFTQIRQLGVHVNPNLSFGVVYSPADLAEILDGFTHQVVPAGGSMLLSHPAHKPDALIAALGEALRAVPAVKGAWLLQAHLGGDPEPSWLLGVDLAGDWSEVQGAIGAACAKADLAGRKLNALPLAGSPLAKQLRGGIPIVAPKKRGLFDLLKG